MQMVYRKPRNNASLTVLLPLLFAANAINHAQTRLIGPWTTAQHLTESQKALPAAVALQIAITFDDLPAHSALPPGQTRLEVATKIIAAPRDARLYERLASRTATRRRGRLASLACGRLSAWQSPLVAP